MQKKAEFLTIAQAAQFLNVSPDTLRRWEDRGIVTPHRTKGGSRRYTLLDLKIAKLNKQSLRSNDLKKKTQFLFRKNYISSKRDLKIAIFTSFLWIFGILIFNLLAPSFLRPTNPDRQILSEQLKQQTGLRKASDTTPVKVYAIEVQLPDNETPVILKMAPSLVGKSPDLPNLRYTNQVDQYYTITPLPQNQAPTLIMNKFLLKDSIIKRN
jgi:excisionase family DNA binding protein